MKSAAAVLLLALLGCVNVFAQRPVHVHWTNTVESVNDTEGIIRWSADIDEGWHIYGMTMPDLGPDAIGPQLTVFTIEPASGLQLIGEVEPSIPATDKFDETLKLKLPMWEGKVEFSQRFKLTDGAKGAYIRGTVEYMACTDKSCTPPTRESFDLSFGTPQTEAAVTVDKVDSVVNSAAEAVVVEESDLWSPVDVEASQSAASPTSQSPWWAILGLGFLGGLVALLTPCVWPMIPMTMSFFLKKGKSRRRAIIDAISYGLSIIVIYLALGLAITALFGASKLNDIATSAVFNVLFFVLLVIFAISFFGAFDIKLPSRWSNAIDNKAENTTGFLSIFFMAFTLVLVSFSCTGPIIGTLLVEAASQASMVGPALGMGGFALGLALPFGLFAFFPSLLKEMPRSGSWLNTVKVVLGFIELILSLKFLSVADLAYGWRILDREVFIALWVVLFILLGIYLLGKIRFSHDSPSEHVGVFRFFLAVASLSFAVYLLPGLWGAPLKSISAFAPPLTTQDFNLYGGTFKEFHDYDEGMAYAKQHNMPVIVDFSGYACVNCRKMEGAVFDTQDVRTVLERDYVLIKLMVDDKQKLAQPFTVEEYGGTTKIETVGDKWSYLQRHKFGINSQPYYVLLDDNGKPLAPARAYDENVKEFVQWLDAGVTEFKNK
ncbi:MAG: thioredoxin family protein [Muribaculaceae bacterium]